MTTKKKTKTKTASKPQSQPHRNNFTTGALDAPVQVNFTETQREQVRAAASATGLTLAAFIRTAALEKSAVRS